MKALEFARQRSALVIGSVLSLVTLALYAPMLQNGFINFDDTGYITENPSVTRGLSWQGIVWAFQSFEQGNWHPLTWISHMMDIQLFGLNPAWHHLINALFHTANTVLVFLLLKQMTGKVWPSAYVAALFGWHPLHVESVAWASERKDVLCAFFWLLTMMVYVSYAKKPRPAIYLLALLLFACSLMAKPMAVTLPFVLLLTDFWPLDRWRQTGAAGAQNQDTTRQPDAVEIRQWWRRGLYLVVEKLPFFLLGLADCWITFVAQKQVGAVLSTAALPFSYRLANALWSYLRYVSKTLCPTGLSIIYPYKPLLPVILVGISIGLLIVWTGLFLVWRKRFPYLLMGWFWFLGTLVPAIGLVQVGAQSMADRYMYIPSIGLFIIMVWGIAELIRYYPRFHNSVRLAGVAILITCLIITSQQIRYWQSTISLFKHAVEVTGDNGVAYYCLGLSCEKNGDHSEALALYQKAVAIAPDYYPSQFGLGSMLLEKGDDTNAMPHLDLAEKLDQRDPKMEFDLGMILLKAGKDSEGINHLQAATRLEADNARYHAYLGFALQKMTNTEAAIDQFSRAVALQPDFAYARYGLASVLTTAGRTNEALAQYEAEVKLREDDPEAHYNLGLARLDNRQFAEAEAEFQRELQLAPGEFRAHYRLAQALCGQGRFAEAVAEYRILLKIVPNFSDGERGIGCDSIGASGIEIAWPSWTASRAFEKLRP
jgi:tetratricopeptide (TPR) repeat protein